MTIFEFVFGLYSIVVSLALTHLLAGAVALIRNAKRVRFSLIFALWAWTAFATTVGNWASVWELRLLEAWPSWSVLLLILTAVVQYVFCAFVTPDVPAEGEIDLVAFHDRERQRYVGAFLGLAVVATAFNLAFGVATAAYSDWLRDTLISTPGAAVALLAFFVRARWAQLLAAVVAATLGLYFLLAASNIG